MPLLHSLSLTLSVFFFQIFSNIVMQKTSVFKPTVPTLTSYKAQADKISSGRVYPEHEALTDSAP